MSDSKDTTSRHLRHKLQSLGRRLDELEEATSKLQKAEDELLDLQDKIIQAEGSNSSLLGDVEALRKRVLKIEGKDEEVRKAEDLCRTVREKLEEEEKLTRELKVEIEQLHRRMAELEKLEEAFGKSKSDCTQLCFSLNEEKNLTRKLSSELETLKARIKEVDSSEARLDKAEQALTAEMEKLRGLTQTFVNERKRLLEKQREDEKIILKLTERLDRQKNKISSAGHEHTDSRDLRIEDDFSTGLTSKLARKKSFDYLKRSDDLGLRNKSENEKNSSDGQEDNKVKDLNQEVERLKNRLKQLELVEEDLKNSESKYAELMEKLQQEQDRTKALSGEVEQLKLQLYGSSNNGESAGSSMAKVLENGKAENEEINVRGGLRHEKPKLRSAAVAEPFANKYKSRDGSPQHRRDTKLRNKDLSNSAESSPTLTRRAHSPAHKVKKALKSGSADTDNGLKDTGKGIEDKVGGATSTSTSSDSKKLSVLSRYPPAVNDQKSWKTSYKSSEIEIKKSKVEKFSRLYTASDSEANNSDVLAVSNKDMALSEKERESTDQDAFSASSHSKANGSYTAYRSHIPSLAAGDHRSEGQSSASEAESAGSRRSVDEQDRGTVSTVLSARAARSPRCTRQQDAYSVASTRSSYDEEQHRSLMTEGTSQDPKHTPSGIEIRRVCSPREALRSKAVIKPAIVEFDRKEVMSGGSTETLTANGKPKVSTKPAVTSKMTSSITFYPNDPSSSRTSSRSSSVSSEPPAKERHTSTSNIVIGPSSEHRGSISIPYEISIPKSEITLRPQQGDANDSESPSSLETSCMEAQLLSQSSFSLQSPETTSDFNNDTESGFESGVSSTTTTVATWKSHGLNHHSAQEDSLSDMRNVTVRSTWKNRGALSVDDSGRGPRLNDSDDETEPTTTWRAYRATTVLDTEETLTSSSKPSPAEVYMRRINSVAPSRDNVNHYRRSRSSAAPVEGGLRSIPHEPVSAQELKPRSRRQPTAADDGEPPHTSWRKQPLGQMDRDQAGNRGTWSSRAPTSRVEGRTGENSRPWSNRRLDN
ncbi:leucine zipper protein 1 [Chanos chanos]|uniref:Leucine zipper protein 1 n=1 Tax=Chanos chanos TaxID=29144 RepID=A0A6J2WG63_CHACN|nr:leucine zipper protein 1 [Chanos chanos]